MTSPNEITPVTNKEYRESRHRGELAGKGQVTNYSV